MIKTMLKPFFKRFFGLFISMTFVSMLAVGLLCCFGSCIVNVRDNYKTFVAKCQDADEIISTNFTSRETLMSVQDLDEVKDVDARLVIDCYLKRDNAEAANSETEHTKVARIFSYNEQDNSIFKREVIKKAKNDSELIKVSLSEKFARNNNVDVDQTIRLGFFDTYATFYVDEIVNTVEGIYPRANSYIWSDNSDFGYIYASEAELGRGLRQLATTILERFANDDLFKEYYEKAVAQTGITIPDLMQTRDDVEYINGLANQIFVKNEEGQNMDDVLLKVTDHLKANGIKIKDQAVRRAFPSLVYMDHALEQVQIASIFLPVFFYTVTMIVVGLFINQIIKAMTPQIGIFTSIGISKWHIVGLFLIFTIIMSLAAGALGAPVGYALCILMAGMMKKTYCIPYITPALNPGVVVGSIVGLLIFAILTTLLATKAIFRITPKDATISNESKRKKLPKALEKLIDKAPMNIKLSTNSIAQNPRRFFVSAFSIFASLVLILLSTFFFVSKEEMIDQSVVRRLNYDCQIYMTSEETDQTFVNGLKDLSEGSDGFEECFYTYLKVDVDSKDDVYLECLAVDTGVSSLITIPTNSGHGNLSVPEKGIILPRCSAEKLHVKKGDNISINGKSITVTDISFQYFHPITYLSREQMKDLDVNFVSSYILNVSDENTSELMTYLTNNRAQSLTVFTESLSKDLHNIFDSTNSMIFIMVGFSIGMAFIILCIMSQNALMEQQRQLTIFRAIGFTVLDISNIWTLQSVAQLLTSSLFGVPVGALSIYILLKMSSSASQTYPFIFSWPVVFMALGFILLVIIACHLISMRSIAKWNIADNTRTRE